MRRRHDDAPSTDDPLIGACRFHDEATASPDREDRALRGLAIKLSLPLVPASCHYTLPLFQSSLQQLPHRHRVPIGYASFNLLATASAEDRRTRHP